MTTYIDHVNARLCECVAKTERLVAFGQNITAGSRLSGLTRGLTAKPGSLLLNTPNIENSLIGIGFGVMLRGQSAIFICKQQDFLLLGLDQIVNTYNAIRERSGLGSFTILSIVVDSGYEGPQSALHNLSDFCSFAHVPGYLIANRHDADVIFPRHLVAPGFRLLGVSQRLFRTELLSWEHGKIDSDDNGDVFGYSVGADATIVAFNLALPQAIDIWRAGRDAGFSNSLFSVNNVWTPNWTKIIDDVRRTRRLVIVDDGKSTNRQSDRFIAEVFAQGRPEIFIDVRRQFSASGLRPNADQLELDTPSIVAALGLPGRSGNNPAQTGSRD